jgi:hypothetical protein
MKYIIQEPDLVVSTSLLLYNNMKKIIHSLAPQTNHKGVTFYLTLLTLFLLALSSRNSSQILKQHQITLIFNRNQYSQMFFTVNESPWVIDYTDFIKGQCYKPFVFVIHAPDKYEMPQLTRVELYPKVRLLGSGSQHLIFLVINNLECLFLAGFSSLI